LSIAVLGAAAVIWFARDLDARLVAAQVPAEVRRAMAEQSLRLAAAEPPAGANAELVRNAVRHAFVHAFRWSVTASAILAALASIGALGVASRKRITQH
jgi:hypothetical protein